MIPCSTRLDADDPAAAEPTFEHLKKGLIRVVLPLPDNMDVIDVDGAVITPADRSISVWRGVPPESLDPLQQQDLLAFSKRCNPHT